MAEQQLASSAHQVAAVEPVIRRVVAARAINPADIDDLVQDCLERLLAARGRLAPEAVLPFAIVTARNLVSSHARTAGRRATAAPRILDPREPERPEELVLAGESRSAMLAALAQLSPEERADILAYYNGGSPAVDDTLISRGAWRVRMARTRAKLRLEYLLAFRHVELPTPACHRVLLAISAGDTRRQRELRAAEHLLDCGTCAELSEPLERRSIALTAFTVPAGLAAWAITKARAQPLHAAGIAAGSAAVAAAAVLGPRLLAPATAPMPHPSASTPTSASVPARPPVQVISHLSVGGRLVADTKTKASLRPLIGEHVTATGVSVVAAATHNGFWIGTTSARIWVQLTGPLEPLHIRAGDHVRFSGTMVGNGSSYPSQIGMTNRGDAALLSRQGAHIAVQTTQIKVEPS